MILDAVADWQELSALYEEAEALDEAGQAAWLARLRAQSHRLLVQVERMLAARARIGSNDFLEALPVLDLGDEEPVPSEWGEGSRIGAYRLVRHLGSGGMAEVWLADRVDGAFERQVAIKLLFDHPSRARRETFVERFRRERDILASLDHPNIARLHDAGVTPSGQPWLALEYVEGESITTWCDHRCVDLQGRVRIFRQVLLAVQHAHANLVLHRDLKPANILVTGDGQVRLLDFGIAKLLEGEGDALVDTALTRQAGRLLTLQYASPEQIRGVALSTACDIYALGVVLYELLCGERPYEVAGMSPAAMEEAILDVHPRLPGSRGAPIEVAVARGTSPVRLKKDLAGGIGAVALHALAKQPDGRYRSAESFGADLDRWLVGLPVEATAPTTADRVIKFLRRNALAASLVGVASLAVLSAGAVALYQGTKAQHEAERALAARDFVLDLLKSADPNSAQERPLALKNVLAEGVRNSQERFAGDPKLRADVLQQIAIVQTRMSEYPDAERTLAAAVELLGRSGPNERWATAQIELALLYVRLGNRANAEQALDAVAPFVEHDATRHRLRSEYYEKRGWLLRGSGLTAAHREFTQALVEARLIENDETGRVVDVLRALAEVESAQNHFSAALGHINEAAATVQRTPNALLNDILGIAFEQARIHYLMGEYALAGEIASGGLSRCRRALGELAEQCILLLDQRAKIDLVRGETAAALESLPTLRKAYDELLSPVRKAEVLLTGARVQAAGGTGLDADVTQRLRQLAQGGPEVALPLSHQLYASLVLAEAALRGNDPAGALRWVDRFEQRQGNADTVDVIRVRARVLRGIALARRGDAAGGLRVIEAAASDSELVLGSGHPLALLYRLNTLQPLMSSGRIDDARALVDAATPSLRQNLGVSSPVLDRAERLVGRVGPTTTKPPSDLFL